jgi:hypothetical protein
METAARRVQYRLKIKKYGMLISFIESFLNRVGSCRQVSARLGVETSRTHLHLESPDEDGDGRDNTKTEGTTPYNVQMLLAEAIKRSIQDGDEDRRYTHIQRRTRGTNAPKTNPTSIIVSNVVSIYMHTKVKAPTSS